MSKKLRNFQVNYQESSIICLRSFATSGSSIKGQVLDLKTLPIFSPLKISVKHKNVRIILETSDTRLLDTLRDVDTIETLREKMMSDRSTEMPLETKITFYLEHFN